MLRLVYRILDNWPLKRQLGYYAYLPAFFAVGAAVEFLMIHMRINNVDFYSVYMEKEQQRLQQEAQRLSQLLDDKKEQYARRVEESTTNKPPK